MKNVIEQISLSVRSRHINNYFLLVSYTVYIMNTAELEMTFGLIAFMSKTKIMYQVFYNKYHHGEIPSWLVTFVGSKNAVKCTKA